MSDGTRVGWIAAWTLAYGIAAWSAPEAPAPKASAPPLPSVLIEKVPHVQQKPDFCGEACAEMALGKLGFQITQDDVFNVAGVDPLLGRGCNTLELAQALKRIGFDVGSAWVSIDAARADAELQGIWKAVHADLAAGIPSIVCMRTDETPEATEHFRLALGYDAAKDEVIYHEPAAAAGAYERIQRARLFALWPLKYKPTQWTVIRLRLKPTGIHASKREPGFGNADYAQHVRELARKRPASGFSMVIEKPFVVIGDDPEKLLRARAEQTVRWAVTRLKAAYFAKDPAHIIDIWLFKNKQSYEKHTRDIFGERPTTPFGYSSDEHHALIMNIETGGGTLVHEIVHPFMGANFPECPSWFNEGLASLYEQSSSRGEQIVGLTNWRLAGLQEAIREKRLPSFKELTGTSSAQFYDEDKGSNYAQARYLCYYLQEKGLLSTYYRRFVADRAKDPTGYETLRAVLGEPDMAAFQIKWETFVLGLRFP